MSILIKGMDMPKCCDDCGLIYLDTGDDAYFGQNEYKCVIDGSSIPVKSPERAYDCPLVDIKTPPAGPKKGKWVKDEDESAKHIEAIYFCSACHNFEAWGEAERYNFCPNCGADMREE